MNPITPITPITLNRIGTPPTRRHVQQRRVEMEAEMAARGERPPGASSNDPVVSMIVNGVAVCASCGRGLARALRGRGRDKGAPHA